MENIDSKLSEGLKLEKKGEKEKAFELYEELLNKINNNQDKVNEPISFIYNRMANIEADKNMENALKYINKSINHAKKLEDNLQLNKSKITKAVILKNSENLEKAEKILKNVIKDLKQEKKESRTEQGIGWALYTLGETHLKMKKLKKAKKELKESIQILESLGDYGGKAAANEKLGDLLKTKKNYNKAINHYEESIQIYNEIGTKKDIDKIKTKITEIKEKNKTS